jgi:HEAT repeat protein
MLARELGARLVICFVVGGTRVAAQGPAQVDQLLGQLQQPSTTDRAREELQREGELDPETKKYLAQRLPPLIERGPSNEFDPWVNAARLAGSLRLAEAVPALAKRIGVNTGGTIGLSDEVILRHSPAARALVDIGEPAVPSLRLILQGAKLNERWVAVWALRAIGSPAAMSGLRAHGPRESDRNLQKLIEKIVGVSSR